MQALLTAVITWLSANYSPPANYDLPSIRFAAPEEIALIRYGAFGRDRRQAAAAYAALGADQQRSIVSVYDDTARRMARCHPGRIVDPRA